MTRQLRKTNVRVFNQEVLFLFPISRFILTLACRKRRLGFAFFCDRVMIYLFFFPRRRYLNQSFSLYVKDVQVPESKVVTGTGTSVVFPNKKILRNRSFSLYCTYVKNTWVSRTKVGIQSQVLQFNCTCIYYNQLKVYYTYPEPFIVFFIGLTAAVHIQLTQYLDVYVPI